MDNLKQVGETIVEVIDPNGAPQSIKAAQHQAFLLQLIQRAGKYVGMIYKANKNLTSFKDGQMSWNNNGFDTSGTFVISFAKKTSDGIDFSEVLSRMADEDAIFIKDFVGRIATLTFKSYTENTSLNTYDVSVIASPSNITYTYQDSEEEICIVSVIKKSQVFENLFAFYNQDDEPAKSIGGNVYRNGFVGLGIKNALKKLHLYGNANGPADIMQETDAERRIEHIMRNGTKGFSFELVGTASQTNTNGLNIKRVRGGSKLFLSFTDNDRIGVFTSEPTADFDINGSVRVRELPQGLNGEEFIVVDADGNFRKLTDILSVLNGNSAVKFTTSKLQFDEFHLFNVAEKEISLNTRFLQIKTGSFLKNALCGFSETNVDASGRNINSLSADYNVGNIFFNPATENDDEIYFNLKQQYNVLFDGSSGTIVPNGVNIKCFLKPKNCTLHWIGQIPEILLFEQKFNSVSGFFNKSFFNDIIINGRRNSSTGGVISNYVIVNSKVYDQNGNITSTSSNTNYQVRINNQPATLEQCTFYLIFEVSQTYADATNSNGNNKSMRINVTNRFLTTEIIK